MPIHTHSLCLGQSFLQSPRPSPAIHRHPRQRLEAVVSEHKRATVIRFQIIDLFPEDEHPEVLADELDHVKRGIRSRRIGREPATCHYVSITYPCI